MNLLICVLSIGLAWLIGLAIGQNHFVSKSETRLHIEITECKKILFENLKGVSGSKATELCTRVDECFSGITVIGPDPAEKCLIRACGESRLNWETDYQCRQFMDLLLQPIDVNNSIQVKTRGRNVFYFK